MGMPRYAQDAISNQGQGGFGGLDFNQIGSSLGSIFSGMRGNSGAPYQDAMDQYSQYGNMASGGQNPFLNMGHQAIPQFQQWLQGQQNPSQFINNLMGQYQESPWAKYQQEQMMRRGMNAASAGGVGNMGGAGLGSTPFLQQSQQNAANISSGDMQNWLGRVLGINTQYGQGLGNEITGGQNSANSLTNLYAQMARDQAEMQQGKSAREGQDDSNMWGGLLGLAGTVGGSLFGGPMGGMAGGAIGRGIGSMF